MQHTTTGTAARSIERLALFGALLSAFGEVHPFCDHWVQGSVTARCKRLYGDHQVYFDGVAVGEETGDRTGQRTMAASTRGRLAVASHVASYTVVQTAAAVGITRAFGYRIPAPALLVGVAVNAGTHAALDRGAFFLWLAGKVGKGGYIEHCQALRLDEEDNLRKEANGPGTAWIELDAALHRVIGVGAAALTTWLATRRRTRR
ncbi:hypothetical protein KV557_24680 [Kitasatospora aureofaciens]|uniref:hypothetical protein n=1 Tax=Kitasatospora aureofaciens TaxID=1894 RepID=UPI001C44DF2C|nr:hypothetical protein [Kitasatospora aureofaciens]MBV6700261.1 hypothetical protein [Kitasatospora aureofaciens]